MQVVPDSSLAYGLEELDVNLSSDLMVCISSSGQNEGDDHPDTPNDIVQQQSLNTLPLYTSSDSIVASKHNRSSSKTKSAIERRIDELGLTKKMHLIIIPIWFICPIHRGLMKDPVSVDGVGQTYDRESITSWLVAHDIDPVTRIILNGQKKVTENIILRGIIIEFLEAEAVRLNIKNDELAKMACSRLRATSM